MWNWCTTCSKRLTCENGWFRFFVSLPCAILLSGSSWSRLFYYGRHSLVRYFLLCHLLLQSIVINKCVSDKSCNFGFALFNDRLESQFPLSLFFFKSFLFHFSFNFLDSLTHQVSEFLFELGHRLLHLLLLLLFLKLFQGGFLIFFCLFDYPHFHDFEFQLVPCLVSSQILLNLESCMVCLKLIVDIECILLPPSAYYSYSISFPHLPQLLVPDPHLIQEPSCMFLYHNTCFILPHLFSLLIKHLLDLINCHLFHLLDLFNFFIFSFVFHWTASLCWHLLIIISLLVDWLEKQSSGLDLYRICGFHLFHFVSHIVWFLQLFEQFVFWNY